MYFVTTPLVRDTVIYNEYVADIQAVRNIEVVSKVNGYMQIVHVDEGEFVRQGQLLFSLRREDFEQELIKAISTVKSARANLKAAEIELKSATELYAKSIISKAELELAEAKTEAAQGDLDEAIADEQQARLNLRFTQVIAPFSGQINRIPNKVGSLIEEGELLTTLTNADEVYAYYNVSEADYLEYTISQRRGEKNLVMLELANRVMHEYTGFTETSESMFDKSTGTIAFRARFKNPTGLIKHGATGKVLVRNEVQNILMIPVKSTFEIQGNVYVMVLDSARHINIRKIFPVYRIGNTLLLDKGLEPSDTILYEGVLLVKEGDAIEPRFTSPDSLLKR
jgi:membrane fusion protein (multidrug efflux system)